MLSRVVQQEAGALDAVFAALADPTRRAIVRRLADGRRASVSELAAPFDMSLTAVSKHLRVLSDAGLVDQRKEGRVRRCRLTAAPLRHAHDWLGDLESFWEGQLDSLAAHLGGPAED
jgi:DNA-binding transcriptional ArsR family regulator